MPGKYPSNVAKRTIKGGGKSEKQCAQESDDLKPEGLSKNESQVWDRICVRLLEEDRMKHLFVDALAEYCYITARMGEITLDLKENGRTYVVDGRNGEQIKNRPEIAERNELFRQWNSLVAQFGLSPAVELRFQSNQLGLPFGGTNGSGVFDGYPQA